MVTPSPVGGAAAVGAALLSRSGTRDHRAPVPSPSLPFGSQSQDISRAQLSTQLTEAFQSLRLPTQPSPAPASSPSPSSLHAVVQATATLSNECTCSDVAVHESQTVCEVSKIAVREDHEARDGLTLADVSAVYGAGALSEVQRQVMTLTRVSATSFMCLDDRVDEPSLVTPGGDLGEFILALASYLQERGQGRVEEPMLTQAEVDAIFAQYLQTLPASRPLTHCTDDAALRHLQDELPAEDLDLRRPPEHAKELGLLQRLTEVENHGDSHIRLMLDKPEWFQLDRVLVPMVLRSFYTSLWRQYQDELSPLYTAPKLRLKIVSGHRDPKAFFEVTSGESCHNLGFAPMLKPQSEGRGFLLSHLDAVSLRRRELAEFFRRIANTTPRKINVEQLHQRLDRHGWLALETTGSQMAAGLPFFTLMYS